MSTPLEQLATALATQYRVERELGAGGMAVVYLAEDLKHHRRVAIKVLRGELAASVGAARFLREIEIAARLQHPHILPLLDSGDAGGQLYYVMPFVEGMSLRERLASDSRLSVSDAVRLLAEIVDALAYAHARGVVHRDIKPDNVMLSGRHALITDFGVARAVSAATGQHQMTSIGIALGTPAYMAPEQATADPNVDHRADIYSVGVMAYELLSGRLPFSGLSAQQMLAAHVTTTPEPLSAHRPDIAPMLERIVMKCLEKQPEDRWQTADELLAQLEPIATPGEGTMPTTSVAATTTPSRRGNPVKVGIAAAALVVIALVARQLAPTFDAESAADGAPFTIARATQFTAEDALEIQPDISPDGRLVAYAAGSSVRMRIFVREVDGVRIIPLSDDSTSIETQPRWSPDGRQLLFLSGGGVRISPALGGTSRAVITSGPGDTVHSVAWSPDGREIAFSRRDSVFIRALNGGTSRLVGTASDLHSCRWSRTGGLIACVSGNSGALLPNGIFGNIGPSDIVVFPAAGGTKQPLRDTVAVHQAPIWSVDGKTLYFVSDRQGTRDIYAVDVAPDGSARGSPRRATTGLGAQSIALSDSGTKLAYSVYTARANVWSVPIGDGVARSSALEPVTSGGQVIESMQVSADGQWLLYDSNLPGHAEIYRVRLPSGAPERLTNSAGEKFRPALSPDGKEFAYHVYGGVSRDIFVQSLDGRPPHQVTTSPSQEAGPVWSPLGNAVAFVEVGGLRRLLVARRDASGQWGASRALAVTDPGSPAWSPDGLTIAFPLAGAIRLAPADSGAERVLYAPAPSSQEPRAEQVVWSADGRLLYFKSHDADGRASFWSIASGGGRPRLLLRLDDLRRPSNRPDFATDGKRLYFAIQDRQSDIWLADITRR